MPAHKNVYALEIDHLSLERANDHRRVIDVPGFAVAQGESVAVMAPSGTGKTLLLKAIAGLLPENIKVAAGSRVRICGVEPGGRKALSRHISYIPQNALNAWAPGIIVERQIARAIKDYEGEFTGLLEQVGLQQTEVKGKYPHQLSGGMCQRLLVAVAIARRPDIILADEPLGSTDHESGVRVLEALSTEQKRGAALVMTTHNRAHAEKHCLRIIHLRGQGC